jgi:hypothetical protein
MTAKSSKSSCMICNPTGAQEGDYCERHQEELHRLEHLYEGMFRLQRGARGKDHEAYDIYMQSQCNPCGRVLLQETDPDNLAITVLLAEDVNLDTGLPEYEALGIHRTWGDLLHIKISQELVQSWYGNARACVDLFHTNFGNQLHWDMEPPDSMMDEDENAPPEPHSHGGGKHSIH